jgi:hypothetical protein
MLLTDERAPVQRTVDLVEDELLRWAKLANRGRTGGNAVWLLASGADQIPTDLDEERDRFLLPGQDADVTLSVRPVRTDELDYLLERVTAVRDGQHGGRLQRLVAGMIGQGPRAAMLHAFYQQARDDALARLYQEGQRPASLKDAHYPAALLDGRLLFGRPGKKGRPVWFSYLADLVELMKILE